MAELNLFLSWSGKLSHAVAEYFVSWIPKMLPRFKPWISSEHIKSGKPWFSTITDQIGKSPVCIIFMTEENALSPWLHLEAGGILMAEDAHVCPYLIDLGPGDVGRSPLSQLQMRRFDKEETWKLIRDLNDRLEPPHEESLVKGTFNSEWPALKKKIEKLIAEHQVVEEEEAEQEPQTISLSPQAQEILLAAASEEYGTIMFVELSGGCHLQVGERSLIEDQSSRNVAPYKSAMLFLEEHGLIRDRNYKGELFEVTDEGYRVADSLRLKLENEKQPDVG